MTTNKNAINVGIVSACLATVAALSIGNSPARATPLQGTPSSKATAAISETQLVAATTGAAWETILSNTLHTANKKDLFVDVALEAGLMTRTVAASKGGNKDTSVAKAEVRVRCMIDGEMAYPGEIILNSRTQTLSATLDGLISSCFIIDDNGDVVLDEDCVEPEEIELILSTMSAHSYNFIYEDCLSGVHTFEIQTRVVTDTEAQQGEASALAMVGRGSVTVEEVRMANNEVIDLD
jgi:hypothetical protein